jgi:phospholipase C
MPTSQLGRIEHIVVLTLENRSFDNLLGWLDDPANLAPFNQIPPANFEVCSCRLVQYSDLKLA